MQIVSDLFCSFVKQNRKAMSDFKSMVFRLDPNNREAEGQLVERYLTALGYEDDVEWDLKCRMNKNYIYIKATTNGLIIYHNHDCRAVTFEPVPSPYQVAVAEHMKEAPQPLAEYVRGRLVSSITWREDQSPINLCEFSWVSSEEGDEFWALVDVKRWERAMATDFWKKHTAPTQAPSERPKGGEKFGEMFGAAVQFEKPEHEEYDFVNPAHYQEFSIEVIDMMAAIWGKEATATHCEMCAFKYKLRAGSKPDQPIERDLEKAAWYLSKAKELRDA